MILPDFLLHPLINHGYWFDTAPVLFDRLLLDHGCWSLGSWILDSIDFISLSLIAVLP